MAVVVPDIGDVDKGDVGTVNHGVLGVDHRDALDASVIIAGDVGDVVLNVMRLGRTCAQAQPKVVEGTAAQDSAERNRKDRDVVIAPVLNSIGEVGRGLDPHPPWSLIAVVRAVVEAKEVRGRIVVVQHAMVHRWLPARSVLKRMPATAKVRKDRVHFVPKLLLAVVPHGPVLAVAHLDRVVPRVVRVVHRDGGEALAGNSRHREVWRAGERRILRVDDRDRLGALHGVVRRVGQAVSNVMHPRRAIAVKPQPEWRAVLKLDVRIFNVRTGRGLGSVVPHLVCRGSRFAVSIEEVAPGLVHAQRVVIVDAEPKPVGVRGRGVAGVGGRIGVLPVEVDHGVVLASDSVEHHVGRAHDSRCFRVFDGDGLLAESHVTGGVLDRVLDHMRAG